MKALLYKQFKLVAHPTTFMFCLFEAMLLIPNYPYTVCYFYVTLGLFFTFQNAREQRDSDFSALLPVRKRDTVKVQILFCAIMELFSIALSIPFVIISNNLRPLGGNEAGIDANVAIIGFAFLVFAVFNLIFLTSFFKSGYKVGASYLKACIGVFVIFALDIVSPHIIPWLNGYDSKQWIILIAGALIYAGATILACKKAISSYEKVDL